MRQSKLTPPPIVFRIVWPLLYTSMFISLIIYILSYRNNWWISNGFIFFTIQLLLNVLWPYLYFNLNQYCLSFILILLLIMSVITTMYFFYQVNKISSFILLPYLIWLLFASYLNAYICKNN
jgi:tryptophan-rich sensory protein